MINGEITHKEWAQKNRAYLGQLKSTKIKNKVTTILNLSKPSDNNDYEAV